MSQFLRFFVVNVLGVILDIGIAYVLASRFGIAVWLAATIGFVTAASVNYVMHQLWSFGDSDKGLSATRAAKYLAATLATLATRIAVVAGLAMVADEKWNLLILICGAGVSFLAHFALSKIYVFADARPRADVS